MTQKANNTLTCQKLHKCRTVRYRTVPNLTHCQPMIDWTVDMRLKAAQESDKAAAPYLLRLAKTDCGQGLVFLNTVDTGTVPAGCNRGGIGQGS
jgi:hypothetical protein